MHTSFILHVNTADCYVSPALWSCVRSIYLWLVTVVPPPNASINGHRCPIRRTVAEAPRVMTGLGVALRWRAVSRPWGSNYSILICMYARRYVLGQAGLLSSCAYGVITHVCTMSPGRQVINNAELGALPSAVRAIIMPSNGLCWRLVCHWALSHDRGGQACAGRLMRGLVSSRRGRSITAFQVCPSAPSVCPLGCLARGGGG
jgi:hypothetical protein